VSESKSTSNCVCCLSERRSLAAALFCFRPAHHQHTPATHYTHTTYAHRTKHKTHHAPLSHLSLLCAACQRSRRGGWLVQYEPSVSGAKSHGSDIFFARLFILRLRRRSRPTFLLLVIVLQELLNSGCDQQRDIQPSLVPSPLSPLVGRAITKKLSSAPASIAPRLQSSSSSPSPSPCQASLINPPMGGGRPPSSTTTTNRRYVACIVFISTIPRHLAISPSRPSDVVRVAESRVVPDLSPRHYHLATTVSPPTAP